MSNLKLDPRRDLLGELKHELVDQLTRDERAAVEAATGEMGNKPDAVKLGWLRMRTKESWTKQRYTVTVNRALAKLRQMVAIEEVAKGAAEAANDSAESRPRPRVD